jgi:hypothetical protein
MDNQFFAVIQIEHWPHSLIPPGTITATGNCGESSSSISLGQARTPRTGYGQVIWLTQSLAINGLDSSIKFEMSRRLPRDRLYN